MSMRINYCSCYCSLKSVPWTFIIYKINWILTQTEVITILIRLYTDRYLEFLSSWLLCKIDHKFCFYFKYYEGVSIFKNFDFRNVFNMSVEVYVFMKALTMKKLSYTLWRVGMDWTKPWFEYFLWKFLSLLLYVIFLASKPFS